MKIEINGNKIEGTPTEIVELLKLTTKKAAKTPTIRKRRKRRKKNKIWTVIEDQTLLNINKLPRGKKKTKQVKKFSREYKRTIPAIYLRIYNLRKTK